MVAVTEAVVQEGNVIVAEGTGSAKPVEHFRTGSLIFRKDTQRANGQRSRLEGVCKDCLRQCLQLRQILGQRRKGESLIHIVTS